MNLVALAGGTGAAKFLRGLASLVRPADLTIVGNTGDDLDIWGLHVSPDLDTVTYTLAGWVDESKGWGVRGDTFRCLEAMGSLGQPTFFSLGDRDLAMHLARTEQMRAGAPLSRITASLVTALGIEIRLLPMSDDPVRTRVRTPDGWLAFQEFFVRDRCLPDVVDVDYEGADRARPAPGVVEAIHRAEAIIICPSNPVSSIGPMLAVRGLRTALLETRAKVIAVSPIVGTAPLSGPAGKMMRAKGHDVSVAGVADVYEGLIDALVIDRRDAGAADALRTRGIAPIVTDIVMDGRESEVRLARAVLEAVT
jgi:LPPG:FO 2-phospho-L-lactate transferase